MVLMVDSRDKLRQFSCVCVALSIGQIVMTNWIVVVIEIYWTGLLVP